MPLLEIKNLKTFFKTKKGIVKAVNDVSYSLEAGKTIGIVGESGSGKSVSAMSILRLLDGNGYIDSGSIQFEGKELNVGSQFDPSVLPEANSVYQVPSCAIEGTDNVYSYPVLELTAYNDGTGEVIYSIYLTDANTPTARGGNLCGWCGRVW